MNCPFCHYDNEEGVLFCEQCKSDLGVLDSTAIPSMKMEQDEFAATPTMPAEMLEENLVLANLVPPEAADTAGEVLAAVAPDTAGPVAETLSISAPLLDPESLMAPVTEQLPVEPNPVPSAGESSAPQSSEPVTAATLPPRLVVTRGQKINEEFPLFEGENYIGRADDKPVDIDLEQQEHPERVWSSRQHAIITLDGGRLTIEDLNSSNGTFVNRSRIMPGDRFPIKPGDVIQVGTVQMKVKA